MQLTMDVSRRGKKKRNSYDTALFLAKPCGSPCASGGLSQGFASQGGGSGPALID